MGKQEYEDCYINTEGKLATIGFADNSQNKKTIENIMFLEYKVSPGSTVAEGDPLLVIEALKGTAELKSRVQGTVKEVNKDVEDNPEMLKDSPEEWLVKIQL